jgi:hypothetical protein
MPYIDNTKQAPDKYLYYKLDSDGHVTNKPYSPKLAIRYIDKKVLRYASHVAYLH